MGDPNRAHMSRLATIASLSGCEQHLA